MTKPPSSTTIYHITHVDNLPSIVRDGFLFSDRAMLVRGGPAAAVGMSNIKQRRLDLPVPCCPDRCVGDFVPFYFCPRSVMLYLLHRGNHPELSYQGGQTPIVHLEADLQGTVTWAETNGHPEFLVHECFPWALVQRIGVFSQAVAGQVQNVLTGMAHQPVVHVVRAWYF